MIAVQEDHNERISTHIITYEPLQHDQNNLLNTLKR